MVFLNVELIILHKAWLSSIFKICFFIASFLLSSVYSIMGGTSCEPPSFSVQAFISTLFRPFIQPLNGFNRIFMIGEIVIFSQIDGNYFCDGCLVINEQYFFSHVYNKTFYFACFVDT